jgi:hypothetical protein
MPGCLRLTLSQEVRAYSHVLLSLLQNSDRTAPGCLLPKGYSVLLISERVNRVIVSESTSAVAHLVGLLIFPSGAYDPGLTFFLLLTSYFQGHIPL